jgi:N-acetyl sugar amidotransferase
MNTIYSTSIQECSRCLLNTEDTAFINFDETGVCNYCRYYEQKTAELGSKEEKEAKLQNKIKEIKKEGKGKKYDCLLGLSGGSDSSYMALLAHRYGLRPLVVHLDNGWNSDTAVNNIEKICDKLNFELYTFVIDWEEFATLQTAYLKAGVIDIEVLTDHAIYAILNKLAAKFKIKYTLSGFNYATEAIMPKGWTHNKRDFLNIKSIVKSQKKGFGFKTYPYVNFTKALYYYWFLKLESFEILNYIDYDKEEAKKELKEKFDWKDYGGKHFESVFTKFYQTYILPEKFGIDKRRAHLSNQICSGKITKEEAKKQLQLELYNPSEIESDIDYILKKFDLSHKEFKNIMLQKPISHANFDTDQRLWNKYFKIIKLLKFGH